MHMTPLITYVMSMRSQAASFCYWFATQDHPSVNIPPFSMLINNNVSIILSVFPKNIYFKKSLLQFTGFSFQLKSTLNLFSISTTLPSINSYGRTKMHPPGITPGTSVYEISALTIKPQELVWQTSGMIMNGTLSNITIPITNCEALEVNSVSFLYNYATFLCIQGGP